MEQNKNINNWGNSETKKSVEKVYIVSADGLVIYVDNTICSYKAGTKVA